MTDTTRPIAALTHLRRSLQPEDTTISVRSTGAFHTGSKKEVGDEVVHCAAFGMDEFNQPVMTGCSRGLDREGGGTEPRYWPAGTEVREVGWTTTEVVTEYPAVATDAMVGRDFAWDAGDGNVYRYHVVEIEGEPIVIWDDAPPSGMDFLWTNLITGINTISGVALDPSGNLYVGYDTVRLRKYNAGLVQQWQVTADFHTRQVATDGTSVFHTIGVVAVIDNIGKRLASTGAIGSPRSFGVGGSDNGQFNVPIGAVFDGTHLWIVDSVNNRVQKLTAAGAYVLLASGLNGPTGACLDPDGVHLWVLNAGAGNVYKVQKSNFGPALSGDTIITLGIGNADGQIGSTAEGIAVDAFGRIWIADTPNHRVQVFDPNGAFLGKIGSFGSGDGQFKFPKQVAFNAAGDVLHIADSGNGRLVTLQEDTGQIAPLITERAGGAVNVTSPGNTSATATCNAGEVSIGGGFSTGASGLVLRRSERSGTTGWTVTMRNDTGGTITVTPSVMCMKSPL